MGAQSERHRETAIYFLLALLVVAAYANSFGNGFASDDYFLIVKNRLITDLRQIPSLYIKDYWASMRDPNEAVPPPTTGLYRPAVVTSYAINYAAGALNPAGYHLVNLLLHLLATCLVYLLAKRLPCSSEGSLAAAAVFAVHPLHTEAVTGVVGRAELLMAVGTMGALLFEVYGYRRLALAAFALGLFSKEQAAVLPAILLLSDLCLASPSPSNVERRTMILAGLIKKYVWYAVVLAAYLAIRAYALGGLQSPPSDSLENPLIHSEWAPRLLTVLKVAGLYIWLFFWPAALSADYSYNSIPIARSLADPWTLWAIAVWTTLLGIAWWAYRRDRRISFGIGVLLITFFPVSNLIVSIGTIMGERLFYLPSAGLCLLLGLGYERAVIFSKLPTSNIALRTFCHVCLALVCLALTYRTMERNRDWSDTETLFRQAVKIVPQNAKAYAYLGKALKDRGEYGRALEAYRTALQLYPEFGGRGDFNAGYGDVLVQMGRVDEGIHALETAVRVDPEWSATRYNLGLAYVRQRRYEDAEAQWRRALALNPRSPHIHNSLSRLFIERRQFTEALVEAEAALRLDPDFLLALGNRAWALEGMGRPEEAAAGYERVLEKNPGFSDLRLRLDRLRGRLALERAR